ncbi:hypothetical protein BCT01_17420 [Vibrio tasmaniensis]|nr:hypothetical protein A162_04690 [Vibrio tasmaniensis 1F-155]PMO75410.1 hypothetical protein BCT01_17420 [Vibrio tasmaniensis]
MVSFVTFEINDTSKRKISQGAAHINQLNILAFNDLHHIKLSNHAKNLILNDTPVQVIKAYVVR